MTYTIVRNINIIKKKLYQYNIIIYIYIYIYHNHQSHFRVVASLCVSQFRLCRFHNFLAKVTPLVSV